MSEPSLYMDQGLEFTKKYNGNMIARVRMSKTTNNDFAAHVTVLQDNIQIVKLKVRIEAEDVSLAAAETIALWATSAPLASSTR